MSGQGFPRRMAFAVALGGTVVVWAGLSSRPIAPARKAVLALSGYHGIPDCPAEALQRLHEPLALECWFYTEDGAWRMRAFVSAHRMLVVRGDATSPAVSTDMARAIVASEAPRYGEILVYATLLGSVASPHSSSDPESVVRTRWTPRAGYSTLEYVQPPVVPGEVVAH